jgi:phosphohistidine phosphatase
MPVHRLLLIRHAKAAAGANDPERPLAERGIRDAEAIGRWLVQAGFLPDHVLVSTARRARQTWERASAALTSSPEPTVEPRIYDNSPQSLLAAIRDVPEEVQTLALVGHNPSIAELADLLDDGDPDPDARHELDAGFKTGGVALFEVPAAFPSTAPGEARLTGFTVPRG